MELLHKGAASYTVIEFYRKMVVLVKLHITNCNAKILHVKVIIRSYFDRVTSRFALHYVSNIELFFFANV